MKKRIAVIGKDVSKSLSPAIHNYWLDKYAIDSTYEAISLSENELESFLYNASDDYIGFNVTMPYKVKVIDYLGDIEAQAKIIGSVNTIKYEHNLIKGYNTDILALIEVNNELINLNKINQVMIIGNGGVTKTLLYLYKTLYKVSKIYLISTKHDDSLSCDDGVILCSYSNYDNIAKEVDIIINTTPFNQTIQGISFESFKKNCIYFDLNYLESDFLIRAKNYFSTILDGKKMFVYQARASFFHWFNFYPECDDYIWKQIIKL